MYETYFIGLIEEACPVMRLSRGSNKANIIFPSGGKTRRLWNDVLL